MNERVLLVDDEPNVLQSYQRSLHKEPFQLEVAVGGPQALEAMKRSGPYAVVVSDMRMPSMDGIQFLARARELAPRTVRMMLTGAGDLDTAMRAIREGSIFRFLTKPCSPDVLSESVRAGLEQYRLVMAEVELLEKTLTGSIKMLTDLLAMLDAESFGRTETIRQCCYAVVKALGLPPSWTVDLAATLAPIGYVTVPQIVLAKSRAGQPLSPLEAKVLERVPEVGFRLIENIPRLETVARVVLYQWKNFDGTGVPADDVRGDQIPLGARILRVVTDMLRLEVGGLTRQEALLRMSEQVGCYDLAVLAAAARHFRVVLSPVFSLAFGSGASASPGTPVLPTTAAQWDLPAASGTATPHGFEGAAALGGSSFVAPPPAAVPAYPPSPPVFGPGLPPAPVSATTPPPAPQPAPSQATAPAPAKGPVPLPNLPSQRINAKQLRVGHVLLANLLTSDGRVLLAAGTTITSPILERVHNVATLGGLQEPIRVLSPR